MKIDLCSATWFQPEMPRCIASWNRPVLLIPRMSILPAYQKALEMTSGDVIGYVHDDLICRDPEWEARVLREFESPDVAVVGFAGGKGHGHAAMYQVPFTPSSMGRVGFCSNLVNWHVHGAHLTDAKDGAVLDGIALFIRRSFLEGIGGWPLNTPVSYFMYTEWLCCMARRHGRRIRIVGVACEHLGGKSTGLNPDLNPDFQGEHRWLYEEFRDVLPWRVSQ